MSYRSRARWQAFAGRNVLRSSSVHTQVPSTERSVAALQRLSVLPFCGRNNRRPRLSVRRLSVAKTSAYSQYSSLTTGQAVCITVPAKALCAPAEEGSRTAACGWHGLAFATGISYCKRGVEAEKVDQQPVAGRRRAATPRAVLSGEGRHVSARKCRRGIDGVDRRTDRHCNRRRGVTSGHAHGGRVVRPPNQDVGRRTGIHCE